MPTDKPKVSAYVPQQIKERLIQFKEERALTSESEALTIILAEYFGLEETIKQSTGETTIGGVTLAAFQEMKELVASLLNRVEKLESTGKLPQQPTENQLVLLDELSEIKPISGNKLSVVRFGLNKDAVAGKKRKLSTEKFTQWTRGQDPDGIAWKPVGSPTKGYVPEGGLPFELQSKLLKWINENG